jgi:putative pyruvate formate lyase activating enzyme
VTSASYTYLSTSDWNERIARFDAIARSCTLCPRNCHANRFNNERGFCGAPGTLYLSSIFAHHGEEPPISGSGGSGTVFFSYCTLKCCFCQNYQISHHAEGRTFTPDELAERMIALQEQGCHNINLVTATQFLPWILRALQIASEKGLGIPIVYNCGGYEHPSIIRLLSGIVDIYLPDMKYGGNHAAELFSSTANYRTFNRATIREMFRQVGPMRFDEAGIATRGLCIRHLVLPGGLAESKAVLEYLLATFDPDDIYISLMAQYRPLFRAGEHPEINRMLTPEEFERVRRAFIDAGFPGYYQEIATINEAFVIDFTKRKSETLRESSEGCAALQESS